MSSANFKYKIKREFNCHSECVIYCIKCLKCPAIYIGQTKRTVQERMSEHLGLIRSKKKDTSVAEHFHSDNGHDINDFSFTCLCFAPANKNARLDLEKRLIFNFQSMKDEGLNREYNIREN